jgi:streptogramin lyase
MRRVLPLLIAAASLGCSDRERLNPLDPSNPETGGAPPGFEALADDRSVVLTWQRAGSSELSYVLSRRVGAAGAFTTLAALGHDATFFQDPGLTNGTDYSYRLQYETPDGGLGVPVEDTATPGTAEPWVADADAGAVLRITPDARHVAERFTGRMDAPFAVDVYPVSARVWACDTRDLFTMTSDGSQPTPVGSLAAPLDVAVDRSSGDAWVTDDVLGAVQRFSPSDFSTPQAEMRGLQMPIAVAVDTQDGSVWVCERGADRLRHVAVNGAPLGSSPVIAPSRVAVDSLTRNVWVSSLTTETVIRFSPEGAPLDTLHGFQGPIGVAVDNRIGSIWVADAVAGHVLAYDRAGTLQLNVPVAGAREISIDLRSGDAWVTIPGSKQIARIQRTGVVRRLGGLMLPLDIALR